MRVQLVAILKSGVSWSVAFDGDVATWTRRRSLKTTSCSRCWRTISYGDEVAAPPKDIRYAGARVHVECLEPGSARLR